MTKPTALRRVVAPAAVAVSVSEIKKHLRIDLDFTDEDDLLVGYIAAAIAHCEQYQNRAYMPQTWEAVYDCWPDFPVTLPQAPMQSVVSVKYTDSTGTTSTLAGTEYIVDADSEPGRIVLASGKSLPNVTLQPIGAVRIRYVSGYADADTVPAEVKHAIKLLVGHMYENREATGKPLEELPFAVTALLDMDRVVSA